MRKFAFLFLLIFLSSFIQPVLAASVSDNSLCAVKIPGYATARITNSNVGKYHLIPLDNGAAVWEERTNSSGYVRIVYYNGSSQKTLTENGALLDAAGSNKIVWMEKTGANWRTDIFYFDGVNTKQLTFPNNDIQNIRARIDSAGDIVWINVVSEPSFDSKLNTILGAYQIMFFDTKITQVISSSLGGYDQPEFISGDVEWIGIKNTDLTPVTSGNANLDKRKLFIWKNGILTETSFPEISSDNTVKGSVISYVNTTGKLVLYDWKNKTKNEIGMSLPPLSISTQDSMFFAWSSMGGERFLWNGITAVDLNQSIPSGYNTVNIFGAYLDSSGRPFSNDQTNFLLTAAQKVKATEVMTVDTYLKNQVFIYNIQNKNLTQFSDAPTTSANVMSGAVNAWYGKQNDLYWIVQTPETNYQTNDICHAILSNLNVVIPAPKSVPAVAAPIILTPLSIPEVNVSQPSSSVAVSIQDPSNFTALLTALGTTSNPTDFGKYRDAAKSDATVLGVNLTDKQQSAIANFVTYGASTETVKLGSGERRALTRDYFETVGRADVSWEDIQRLTTGRKPVGRNLIKEQAAAGIALKDFQKMVGHSPDFTNSSEDLAWNTMLYRIRFPRDLSAEQQGITKFKKIFKHLPSSPLEWSEVRALGYALK